jgi:hypothetical protein
MAVDLELGEKGVARQVALLAEAWVAEKGAVVMVEAMVAEETVLR